MRPLSSISTAVALLFLFVLIASALHLEWYAAVGFLILCYALKWLYRRVKPSAKRPIVTPHGAPSLEDADMHQRWVRDRRLLRRTGRIDREGNWY
jgi:hypothetical protein